MGHIYTLILVFNSIFGGQAIITVERDFYTFESCVKYSKYYADVIYSQTTNKYEILDAEAYCKRKEEWQDI